MAVTLIPVDGRALARQLPYPAPDANKYTRGKLVVVGGSKAYPGSACLASKAGLFAGAGYVECLCHPQSLPLVQAFAPSLVVRSWEAASPHDWGLTCMDAQHPKACLVGSGMFADGSFQDQLVSALVSECAVPLVLDGGALRVVAEGKLQGEVRRRVERGALTIMTPHGGEAAALALAAGVDVPAEGESWEAQATYAQSLAAAYGACLLLKGPCSFIACVGQDEVHVMDEGSAALAKAGTGDVLAGIVGAFAAQGMDAGPAADLASFIHARAGSLAEEELGLISVTAEDVLAHLPEAFLSLS